jgi:hypothetical protein
MPHLCGLHILRLDFFHLTEYSQLDMSCYALSCCFGCSFSVKEKRVFALNWYVSILVCSREL